VYQNGRAIGTLLHPSKHNNNEEQHINLNNQAGNLLTDEQTKANETKAIYANWPDEGSSLFYSCRGRQSRL